MVLVDDMLVCSLFDGVKSWSKAVVVKSCRLEGVLEENEIVFI